MKGKIFNAQEVQAIMSGNKIMFREVVKPQPNNHDGRTALGLGVEDNGQLLWQNGDSGWYEDYDNVKCPYQVGQKIFVKESFYEDTMCRKFQGFDEIENTMQINARYMRPEHSRLTLQIKSVGVEKLAQISVVDARDEACPLEEHPHKKEDFDKIMLQSEINPFLKNFIRNWNATHKKPEEKFEANCWVWVISFEVVK